MIDSSGAQSGIARCSIIVNPVNDAPLAQSWTQTGLEDVPQFVDFRVRINDVDNTIDSLTVIITSLPSNGQLFISNDGGNTYTVSVTSIGTVISSSLSIFFFYIRLKKK